MARIRFYLSTPLAMPSNKPAAPLMLDGLLGYAWALDNGLFKTPAEELPGNLVFPDLPLEKIGERCYAASAMIIPPEASMEPTMLVRHADWAAAMAKRGQGDLAYNVGSGWMKGAQEVLWLLVTPYIDFYCRGDLERIKPLVRIIQDIGHIGPKRHSGYGRVHGVAVSTKCEDWAVWREGQPTRPLPVAGFQDKLPAGAAPAVDWSTYYPPYWFMGNATWCYVPPVFQYRPAAPVENVLAAAGKHLEDARRKFEQRAEQAAAAESTNGAAKTERRRKNA